MGPARPRRPLSVRESVNSADNRLAMPDGVSIRYGVWTCARPQPRGSVLLLGGRMEFLEKYAETVTDLTRRGFDVYSFDWRGQGLSARLLANRHKGHVDSYAAYLRDLDGFIRRILLPAAVPPHIVLAHSMGAHIALRYLHDHGAVFARAIFTAPMFDIRTFPFPKTLARALTQRAVRQGRSREYAAGAGDYGPREERFAGNRLTSDPRRFAAMVAMVRHNPDLALGGVTWGWLRATFDSIDLIAPAAYGMEVAAPVLILSAGRDRIVSNRAQQKLVAALPDCRWDCLPGARHEILMETDAVRNRFWQAFDCFTAGAVPGQTHQRAELG